MAGRHGVQNVASDPTAADWFAESRKVLAATPSSFNASAESAAASAWRLLRRGASSCRPRTPGSCRRRRSTCESPSAARMWVAMRSRNQRSWLITMIEPANSSSASSSARRVSTSRSFDGSSSISTLPPCDQRLGQVQPAALAAGEVADQLLLVVALEVEAAEVGAAGHHELADDEDVEAARDVLPHRLVVLELFAASGRRRPSSPSGRS